MTFQDPIIGAEAATTGRAAPPKSRRMLAITLGLVGAVIVIGGVFAWRYVTGFGSATEAAGAVPSDADFYVNIDLATFLDTDRLDQIGRTFPEAFADFNTTDDVVGELDAQLHSELGVTFTDDVLPWLGRSIGVAGWDLDLYSGAPENILLAIKVRDGDAADRFVERLAGVGQGGTIGYHQDVALWEFLLDGETTFAARVEDVLLMSPSSEAVDVGIDAKLGMTESLEQNPHYLEALSMLPSGPGSVMAYFSGGLWDDMLDPAGAYVGVGRPFREFGSITSAIAAMTVADEGVRIDGASVMDSEMAAAYANDRVSEAVALVPADALFYLAADYGPVMDAYAEMFNDPAFSGGDWESELGFDPVTDGIELLDGRFTIYGRPGLDPAEVAAIDLGLGATMGLTDPARMNTTLDRIDELMRESGGPVATRDGDMRRVDLGLGEAGFVYGVTGNELTVAYNTDPAADRIGPRVSDNPQYQRLADALGGELTLYVDVPALFTRYRADGEGAEALRPIGQIGATWNAEGDVATGSLIVWVDWAE